MLDATITEAADTVKPWALRGHDRAPERFDTLPQAIAAIDTIDAAINGWIEGPNGFRAYPDQLTRHRKGLELITL